MESTPILPAALTSAPAQYSQAVEGEPAVISSDFETFLKMLTAQMENQDPLNPVESTDYAVQLATFSGVEQQVRTNNLLEGLGAKLGLMGMSDIAGWVGQEARTSAPAYFDQAPITLVPNPASGADAVRLVVKNSAGDVIENTSQPVSREPFEWSGRDQDGNYYPEGSYSFELISESQGRQIASTQVEAYSRITETRNEDNALWLILESGARVSAENVVAIREPR